MAGRNTRIEKSGANHIRFGRMQQRQQEAQHELIADRLKGLSEAFGKQWSPSPDIKQKYLRDAGHLAFKRSGARSLDGGLRVFSPAHC